MSEYLYIFLCILILKLTFQTNTVLNVKSCICWCLSIIEYLQGVSEIKTKSFSEENQAISIFSVLPAVRISSSCFQIVFYGTILSLLCKPSISLTENKNILWMKYYQENIMECKGGGGEGWMVFTAEQAVLQLYCWSYFRTFYIALSYVQHPLSLPTTTFFLYPVINLSFLFEMKTHPI